MVRPMAKLRKGANKVKEVLSANEEFVLFIESLTPSIDFRQVIKRTTLEELAADLLNRVTDPIDAALAAAKLTVEDIDEVEIIGGGVRIPSVQQRLRDALGECVPGMRVCRAQHPPPPSPGASPVPLRLVSLPRLPLGVHLNGDESMALGASFLAANRSKAFNVRKVGMVDKFPFAIGVRLAELPGAEVEVPVDEEGKPGKGAWLQRMYPRSTSARAASHPPRVLTHPWHRPRPQPGTSARSCSASTTACRA